jgi:hypothetical protein
MNRIGRAFLLSGCLLALASGALMAGPPCGPVTLTVGNAAASGNVQFTLGSGSSDSIQYTLQVPVSAGDTSFVIASRISAMVNVNGGSWQAQVNTDNSVSFFHLENGAWNPVNSIFGVQDTASASVKLYTYHVKSYVEISLNAAATGHSQMVLSVAGEATPMYYGFFQGQSASSIMDAIATYLNSAGPGLSYTRLAPNKIGIHFSYVNSWVSFQTNDPGLQGKWSESDKINDCSSQSGLIQN